MENTVACGAALIAQLYLQEGCLCLAEKKITMAYELENGRVCHSLRVLGVGACDRNRDCFCVSNKSAILPGKDHAWSEIARSVVQQPMLRATLPDVAPITTPVAPVAPVAPVMAESESESESESSDSECCMVQRHQQTVYAATMHATLIPPKPQPQPQPKPQPQPALKPVTLAQPASKPAQPVAPAPKPVAPVVKPVAPVMQPATQPSVKPAPAQAAQPVAQPVVQPMQPTSLRRKSSALRPRRVLAPKPEPAQPVQPVQPAQPVQPVQPVLTPKPAQPVQSVQPAQTVQPTQTLQTLQPAPSEPLDLSLIPSTESVLRAAEQPDYLDIRESTFTYLNPTGTGTFPIYDTLTKRMRGFIHYADFQKEGPYEEFFDEKRQRPKIRGYYRSGERHGDFVCFYDMPGSPVECRVHYDNGMRDGWYVRYDRFGQVRCAILYGHGVEHRRVEYRADGRIYRVVERAKGAKEELVTIVEMKENNFVHYMGQARREKHEKEYVYRYHGVGTLFVDFLACLRTQWVNGFAVVGQNHVSVVDCLTCVQMKKSVTVKPTKSGVSVPWQVLPITGKDTLKVTLNGTEWVVRDKKKVMVGKEVGVETTVFGLFGYVIKKVLVVGGKTTYTDYYPLPGNGKDLAVDGIVVNPCVAGVMEKPVIKTITVAQGSKVLSEEKFLNTGVKQK